MKRRGYSISVRAALHARLKERAHAEGVSISVLLDHVLADVLKKQQLH